MSYFCQDSFNTKTKTLFFVLEVPWNQDLGLVKWMCLCTYVRTWCARHSQVFREVSPSSNFMQNCLDSVDFSSHPSLTHCFSVCSLAWPIFMQPQLV